MLLLAMFVIVIIGALIFITVRFSRLNYEKEHGVLTKAEKLRFLFLFIVNLVAISSLMYFYPVYGFTYIVSIIAIFFVGAIPIKKGIIKDFLYSSLICSMVAGLIGLVLKAGI